MNKITWQIIREKKFLLNVVMIILFVIVKGSYLEAMTMAKGIDYSSTEPKAWNMSRGFTEEKIMKVVVQLDRDQTEAQYGFLEVKDRIKNSNLPKEKLDYMKFKAFQSLVSNLRLLLENCKFKITDKKLIEKYIKKIKFIQEEIIDQWENKVKGDTIKLNKTYKVLLDYVIEMKSDVNTPLNDSGLIYMTGSEESDPDSILESYVDRASKQA